MVNDVLRPSLANRHFHRIQHKLGAQVVAMDQPTTLRLQASSTTAKYRKPDTVGT